MNEEKDEIRIIALKEMERIFTELKGDYMQEPERKLLQSIQDKISSRIIDLENGEDE